MSYESAIVIIAVALCPTLPVCVASKWVAPPTADGVNTAGNVQQSATMPAEKEETLPELSVELLGPITSLKGHEWPRGYDWVREKHDQPKSQILVKEPHELVLQLPHGRSIRHISKATFFNQERGVVVRASIMPHPGLLHYQDAIKLLELILDRWDAAPDDRTKKLITQWKTEGDRVPNAMVERKGSAVFWAEEEVGIFFQIRSDWHEQGWFLTIDVAATLEEHRKLWGSSTAPASQPATNPSNDAR